MTSTVEGAESVAGDVAVMVVELTTVTPVAAVAPKATVAPLMKLVPVIVTEVPPPDGPLFGFTLVTAGCTALYVNWSPETVGDVPPEVITRTLTTPGVRVDGETAVIEVGELTTTPVAAVVPKLTEAPVMKLVPVIVIDVPPPDGPDVGLIDVMAGCTAL